MTIYALMLRPAGQALTALLLLTLIWQLYNLLMARAMAAGRAQLVSLALLLAEAAFLLPLLSAMDGVGYRTVPAAAAFCRRLPGGVLPGVICVFVLATGLLTLRLLAMRRTRITPFAIKDSLDTLPAGICIGDSLGAPEMLNIEMDRISTELTGGPVMNTHRFWQAVTEASVAPEGEDPILSLGSGRTYTLRRTTFTRGNAVYEQLTAVDVTELYALHRELREKNEELTAMKRRLLKYGGDVTEVTREREILAAKIAVHDEVGQALLATAHYLQEPDAADLRHVLNQWRGAVVMLSGGDVPEAEVDAAATLIRAARAVGLEVAVDGVLPEENPARNLIINALHECITNTLKHARGDRLSLSVTEDSGGYVFVLRNNGDIPEGPIQETGGLRLLRQMAEACGGSMTVRTAPEFTLTITAPKGAEL